MKNRFLKIFLIGLTVFMAQFSFAQTLNQVIAIVNDDVILESDLSERLFAVKNSLRAQGTDLPPNSVLKRQVLERLILEELQLQLAKAQGIRVSDEMLNNSIQNIASSNQLSPEAFRLELEKSGFNFAEYRETIRKQITIQRLHQRRILDRISITQQEINNFLSTQMVQGNVEDEFKVRHILIAISEGASPKEIKQKQEKANKLLSEIKAGADFAKLAVANSDGQKALEGGNLGWRKGGELPTAFITALSKMNINEVSDLIRSPSGFHIIKLEKRRGGPKHLITQHLAQHILIKPDAIQSEKEVIQHLSRLKNRAENGEDFSSLARAHSQDKGTANDGGKLGWVNPGEMVPEFEQVMKRLKPGQISKPFDSRYGWHIIKLLNKRNRDNTKEFKRAEARRLVRQRKFQEELQAWRRQIREEAFVDIKIAIK